MTDAAERLYPPEQHLNAQELSLIQGFDFRLNNDLTSALLIADGLKKQPDNIKLGEQLAALQQYFFERVMAVGDAASALGASSNESLKSLEPILQQVIDQLSSIAGMIMMFFNDRSSEGAEDFYMALKDAQERLHVTSQQVAMHPAYRAYKDYIIKNQLEGSRSSFSTYSKNLHSA